MINYNPSIKYFCYRNLHAKGITYSMKNVKTNLVDKKQGNILLKDVSLKVSQAGRTRVIKKQQKNVHAGISGYEANLNELDPNLLWVNIRYNPYNNIHFGIHTNEGSLMFFRSSYAILNSSGLWIPANLKIYPKNVKLFRLDQIQNGFVSQKETA